MVAYAVDQKVRHMPLVGGFLLIALFIWLAENISTYMRVWLYPDQLHAWTLVSVNKIGSWLLLMVISFIMVDLLHYARLKITAKPAVA